MSDKKQIPSILEWMKENGWSEGDQLSKACLATYAKEVVKYTLEQAAERGDIKEVKKVEMYDYADSSNYGIDKQSILSLEEQITKDLGL